MNSICIYTYTHIYLPITSPKHHLPSNSIGIYSVFSRLSLHIFVYNLIFRYALSRFLGSVFPLGAPPPARIEYEEHLGPRTANLHCQFAVAAAGLCLCLRWAHLTAPLTHTSGTEVGGALLQDQPAAESYRPTAKHADLPMPGSQTLEQVLHISCADRIM